MGKSSILKQTGCFKKTIGFLIVFLCAIMTLAVPASQADEIYQYVSWGPSSVPWNTNSTPTINKFDSSLGTLTSVTLTYTSNLLTGSTKTYNIGPTENVTTYLRESAQLTIGNSRTTQFPVYTWTDEITGGGGSVSHTLEQTVTTTDTFTVTNTSDVAHFIGSGAVSYTVTTSNISSAGGTDAYIQTSDVTSSGGLTVTYTYTPTGLSVPEPSSSLIFLLGLVGIAGLNRRFRSQPEDPVASIHWSDWGFRNQDEI